VEEKEVDDESMTESALTPTQFTSCELLVFPRSVNKMTGVDSWFIIGTNEDDGTCLAVSVNDLHPQTAIIKNYVLPDETVLGRQQKKTVPG
jgi:hypothetical protein